jgi:hypothetical protein
MNFDIKVFWYEPEEEIADRATHKIRDPMIMADGFSKVNDDLPPPTERWANGVAPARDFFRREDVLRRHDRSGGFSL